MQWPRCRPCSQMPTPPHLRGSGAALLAGPRSPATETVNKWRTSPSRPSSGSGSWDVRAHRLSTRARRTTSSGHIPNKKSQLRPARPEHHRLQVHHLHERKLAARMSVTGKAGASATAPYICRPGWHGSNPAEPSGSASASTKRQVLAGQLLTDKSVEETA